MESTLAWRDNKIKALEAQRDYFQKQAQSQIAQVLERRASIQVRFCMILMYDGFLIKCVVDCVVQLLCLREGKKTNLFVF